MAQLAEIHAEITADGKMIFLIPVGPDMRVDSSLNLLKTLTPLFTHSVPKGAIQMPLTWAAIVQLSSTFGQWWKPGPRLAGWIGDELQRRVPQPRPGALSNSAGHSLRDYQLDGGALLAGTGRGFLFDSPGVGKTATALYALFLRQQRGFPIFPAVVVCPASVIDSWLREVAAWFPRWRARAWRGPANFRKELPGTADIFVVSYETCRVDTLGSASKAKKANPLLDVHAVSVISDECHKLKSQHTKQSRAVVKLAEHAQHFFGLSGTPLTHSPADLWPALNALAPGAWPSRERWINRNCQIVRGDYQDTILGLHPGREEEFRLCLMGQERRVDKLDVLKELPPKLYTVREVELPAEWRKVYDQMEDQMLAQLPELDGDAPADASDEMSVMGVLAQLTRLSQLSCAPADVRSWMTDEPDPFNPALTIEKEHVEVTLKCPSWKVDALLEILEERPGRPAIATAESAQLMRLAGDAAVKAGLKVGYVIGGQTPKQRTADIDAFQAGQLDLICITTGAGGVGITLTAADTVVFLQRPWSIVDSIQLEDRAHRLGSERHVCIEYIDVIARNTIDTRRRAILRERAGQLSDFLRDPRIVENLLGGDATKRGNRKKVA